jgi:hypothetical protein
MRLLFKIFFSAFAAAFLSSCLFLGPSVKGNGEVVEQVRNLGKFSGVKVTSGMNVEFVQGDETKVVVVADENLQKVIETKVISGTLEIRALANIWSATSKKVMVTTNNLREISGTAGSNINTDGQLTVDQLNIRASAGSNFRMDLVGQYIDISISSGANVFLSGKSKQLIARSSSGANLKAEDFEAEISDVKVSSGSNVWVTTMKELTAHASSGGNIFSYGKPSKTNTTTSSGGNVTQRE